MERFIDCPRFVRPSSVKSVRFKGIQRKSSICRSRQSPRCDIILFPPLFSLLLLSWKAFQDRKICFAGKYIWLKRVINHSYCQNHFSIISKGWRQSFSARSGTFSSFSRFPQESNHELLFAMRRCFLLVIASRLNCQGITKRKTWPTICKYWLCIISTPTLIIYIAASWRGKKIIWFNSVGCEMWGKSIAFQLNVSEIWLWLTVHSPYSVCFTVSHPGYSN